MTLAVQAKKVLNVINQVNYNCNYSLKCGCTKFDKCMFPAITYGSEIWCLDTHREIEIVHSRFCESQLGVGMYTPNSAVLGDCGRKPV